MELITKDFGRLNGFSYENFSQTLGSPVNVTPRLVKKNKKGSKIHIKEKNKGRSKVHLQLLSMWVAIRPEGVVSRQGE